jgi:hypothetical protein
MICADVANWLGGHTTCWHAYQSAILCSLLKLEPAIDLVLTASQPFQQLLTALMQESRSAFPAFYFKYRSAREVTPYDWPSAFRVRAFIKHHFHIIRQTGRKLRRQRRM